MNLQSHNNTSAPKGTLLLKNIQKHIQLSHSERTKAISFFEEEDVSKKVEVVQQGKPCNTFCFVEEGSLRAYHTNADGKESTVMFAVEDWWITDMGAFMNQSTAQLSLEALEDSRLFMLKRGAFEGLVRELPQLESYFRILFQKAYIREQQRILNAISVPLEERYLGFLKKYPQIVAKVTQKQIASYLGVTPEFLSMVKNKISS